MITIFIKGIILFVAATVYDSGLDRARTGAAIAVRATGGGSSYGVMLPSHKTQLILVASDVQSVSPPFMLDGTEYIADLDGYRVQIGNYANNVCKGMTGGGAKGDLVAKGVPDISKLGLTTTIAAKARPTANEYKDIDKTLVAAWFEMRDGDLDTEGRSDMQAEFRPATNVTYNPIQTVKWTVQNSAPCLIVTRFGEADGFVVFKPNTSPVVRFENLPDPASNHHGRAFASYDFELLYRVLDKKPDMPPIPHQIFKDAHDGEAAFLRHCVLSCSRASQPTGDPVSGMNCGPGNDSYP